MVERFDVCPFALPAMKGDNVARHALDRFDEAAPIVDALAADEKIEVALLVFPTLTASYAEFDAACQPLRTRHPAFVAAVFHPATPYDATTPAQAVGFFRRAPDPTLQLVRQSVLQSVRGPDGKFLFDYSPEAWAQLKKREHKLPTSERIARSNHALLAGRIGELEAIYRDIAADRAASYARVGG